MTAGLRAATMAALLAGAAALSGCGGDPVSTSTGRPTTTATTPPGLDVPPGVSGSASAGP